MKQTFQRLMITYNGRVGMCCHDWGAQHGVGFVSNDAFTNDKKTLLLVEIESVPNQFPQDTHSFLYTLFGAEGISRGLNNPFILF